MSDYENQDADFHYENSGASMEEMQHSENCEWIYGNCQKYHECSRDSKEGH